MSELSKVWSGLAVIALAALVASVAWAEDAAVAPEPAAEATTAAQPVSADTASADTIVATVNGTAITLGHMIVLRAQLPAEYQNLPDDVLFSGILDQLVQQTALSQSMEPAITRRDALAMENDRRSYLAGAAIEAASAMEITEEVLQALYTERYASVEPAREFHAAHILVATEDEARALKAEIDAGADFAEVAMEHSSDGAAAGGGDLGWFGLGMMVKEFEDAVVSMQAGQVSDPVQTQFGWHLVKLTETRSIAAPALADVREELLTEARQKAVETRIAELTAAATVSRAVEGIDPAILRDQTLLAN